MSREIQRMRRIVGDGMSFTILSEYLNSVRRIHQKTLEQSTNEIDIYRAQGAIRVIDNMLHLKDALKEIEENE